MPNPTDENKILEARVAALEAALQPFAGYARWKDQRRQEAKLPPWPDNVIIVGAASEEDSNAGVAIVMGQMRAAAALLAKKA